MGNNTIVPGINQPSQQFGQIPTATPQNTSLASRNRLCGFLYSVSKTLAGEYWPLYIGGNSIGRASSNAVVLEEATVSEEHANIHIISRADNLIVYITDTRSKTGTLLNGTLLRGEADLKNGDVITIGEAYELYVILVDVEAAGLKPKETFQTTEPAGQPSAYQQNVPFNNPTVPFPNMPTAPFPTQAPKAGRETVVDGTGSAPTGGHTVIMGSPFDQNK